MFKAINLPDNPIWVLLVYPDRLIAANDEDYTPPKQYA